MNISYETVITPNEFGGYDVSCPDLMPHTTWSAADIANAAGLGAYVMAFAVERHIEAGTPLPAASSGHRPAKGGFVLNARRAGILGASRRACASGMPARRLCPLRIPGAAPICPL